MMYYNYVVLMISYILLNMLPIQANTCQESLSKFSISTRRNNTGHWYSLVSMHLNADATTGESKQSGPWTLGVNFGRERCGAKESVHIITAITVPPLVPSPDYVFYANIGYYKFHPELKTWQEARGICASEGAHLTILNSDMESNLIKEMFNQYPDIGAFAFIGFHDLYVEGQYLTIFDEPLHTTGFTEFTSGQPDNHKYEGNKADPGEDCGSVARDGKLNDLLCSIQSPFICEQEI